MKKYTGFACLLLLLISLAGVTWSQPGGMTYPYPIAANPGVYTAKTVPVGADLMPVWDSADGNKVKKSTLDQIATLFGGSFIKLQATTPGTAQTGNLNIDGAGLFGGKVQIGRSGISALKTYDYTADSFFIDAYTLNDGTFRRIYDIAATANGASSVIRFLTTEGVADSSERMRISGNGDIDLFTNSVKTGTWEGNRVASNYGGNPEIVVGEAGYTTLSIAVATAGATPVTFVVKDTQVGEAAFPIPATAVLKVVKGGSITVANGVTYTINGFLETGPYQIFTCTGTGSVAIASGQPVYIDWFGSDEAAFTSAVTATPVNGSLHLSNKIYSFVTAVSVNKNIGLVMENGGYISSSVVGTALIFSTAQQDNYYRLNVVRSTTNWTAGNVGVEIGDMVNCSVEIQQIKGFEKGLYLHNTTATGGILAYNKFYLNWLADNQADIYLHNEGTGSVNANEYYGGRFAIFSGIQVGVDRQAIVINGAGTSTIGDNVFYHPVIEIDAADATSTSTALKMLGTATGNRIVIDSYIEGCDYLIDARDNARYNSIEGFLGSLGGSPTTPDTKITDTSNYPGTNIIRWANVNNYPDAGLQPVFPNPDVHSKVLVNSTFGGNNYPTIPGFSVLTAGGYGFAAASIKHNKDYLQVYDGEALGRAIDTTVVKDFWVEHSHHTDYSVAYPLIYIKCYDANGVALTGTSPYYVLGSASDMSTGYTIIQVADYGTAYRITGAYSRVHLRFNTLVKQAWIGMSSSSGSNPVGISSFQVFCGADKGCPASWPGYVTATSTAFASRSDSIEGNSLICNVSPLGGILATGDQVQNLAVASGQAPGWVCVGRVSTLADGGEPAGETVVQVDSVTGINIGDIMGVIITADVGGSQIWFWTTCTPAAGPPKTLTMATGVPAGYTIADNAKVITYRLLALPALP